MEKIISREKLEKFKFYILIIFACGGFAVLAKAFNPDSDMWFLAATGRYIVQNKVVPTINPFVIHEGFDIIVQQWVVDVINYLVYDNFGKIGIYIYAMTMFFLALFLLNNYLKNYIDNYKGRLLIVMFSGLYLLQFANSRPTIISFSIFVILLTVLEKYMKTKKWKLLLILPLLSLIEINCHSAMWPMMFVMIIPYIFPRKISKKSEIKEDIKNWFNTNKIILISMIAMFAIAFINPNGINGILYLVKSYGTADRCGIMEMMSPSIFSFNGIMLMIAFAIYVIYFTRVIVKKTEFKFVNFYMASGTMLLAIMNLRSFWYVILGVIPLLAMLIDEDFKKCSEKAKIKENDEDENIEKKEVPYSSLLKVCIFRIAWIVPVIAIFAGSVEYNYKDCDSVPLNAVEYLDELNKDEIVLFNGFNSGAYLEWAGYKTYMDPRPELFDIKINNKEDIVSEYLNLRVANIDFNEFLDKYKFTHLISLNGYAFSYHLSQSNEYKVVAEGNGYKLFEKINYNK